MNTQTAKLCGQLSKAIYNWKEWDCLVKTPNRDFSSRRFQVHNHECGTLYEKKSGILYICVRGTEITSLSDIVTDINIFPTKFPEMCFELVHGGFFYAACELWNKVNSIFEIGSTNSTHQRPIKKVVCTGHSLGGAVATLLAYYVKHYHSYEVELYTFGSPRVLTTSAKEQWDRGLTSGAEIKHYRFVNNNDIVPKLPLNKWVWEHCGEECYFNSAGKLVKTRSFWRRLWDGVRGRVKGIGRLELDGLSDHKISHYVNNLKKI